MKCLFIGGVADGKWIDLPDKPLPEYWNVPVMPDKPFSYRVSRADLLKGTVSVETYSLRVWRGREGQMIYIYGMQSMNDYEIMLRLMGGYKKCT